MTNRLAIFDCDGTLVDGQASICEAMEAAFASVGLAEPPRLQIRRVIGLSLPVAIGQLFPQCDTETRDAITAAYKHAFRTARGKGMLSQPLFPGILDVLEELHGAGWQLGVATGMSDAGLVHCLDTHGITALFTTLQTADRHPSKPDPAMLEAALFEAAVSARDAVMIGDTAFDMMAAVDSGVRPIGVAWGYHSPEELEEAGAVYVADNPGHLRDYLLS